MNKHIFHSENKELTIGADAVNKLLFSGMMENQRFGYILPLDYTPHTRILTY